MTYLEKLYGLDGKIAVVTGACGKLGKQICKAFSGAGAKVVSVDVTGRDKNEYCIGHFSADISDKEQVENTIKDIFDKHGRIDILVNNAGVSTFEPFEKRPEDKFDWVVDVNLKGTFFCIQQYVNMFDKVKMEKGSIINIGSVFGAISPDFRNYTDCDRKNSEVYGATKAGVIQMTKYFAVHLAGRNIRVNCVSPGGIYNDEDPQGTDFVKNYSCRVPMGRMAKDSEMVGAIIYLAGDVASYTTGQNIIIDGGMSCW